MFSSEPFRRRASPRRSTIPEAHEMTDFHFSAPPRSPTLAPARAREETVCPKRGLSRIFWDSNRQRFERDYMSCSEGEEEPNKTPGNKEGKQPKNDTHGAEEAKKVVDANNNDENKLEQTALGHQEDDGEDNDRMSESQDITDSRTLLDSAKQEAECKRFLALVNAVNDMQPFMPPRNYRKREVKKEEKNEDLVDEADGMKPFLPLRDYPKREVKKEVKKEDKNEDSVDVADAMKPVLPPRNHPRSEIKKEVKKDLKKEAKEKDNNEEPVVIDMADVEDPWFEVEYSDSDNYIEPHISFKHV